MQKLRGLVSQQMTMMATWYQSEQADKDLAQARASSSSTRRALDAGGQRWSRAGEPSDHHRRGSSLLVASARRVWFAPAPSDREIRRRLRDAEAAAEARREFFGGDPDRDTTGGQEMKPRW
jgi:Ti type entry exclusion protein TrbK